MIRSTIEGDPSLDPDIRTQENDEGRSRGVRAVAALAAIVAGVVVADQATKAIVTSWLGPSADERRWEMAGHFLAFEYVENTGAAFGILAGRTWLLSVLALTIGCWFVVAYRDSLPVSALMQAAVGLVLGGALGNLIDRIRLGYVVDFLAVGVWPRFNVADSAITIGLFLLFITVLRDNRTGGANA